MDSETHSYLFRNCRKGLSIIGTISSGYQKNLEETRAVLNYRSFPLMSLSHKIFSSDKSRRKRSSSVGTFSNPSGSCNGEYTSQKIDKKKIKVLHGLGELTYLDGSNYKGQWDTGKRQGQGRFTWPDGSFYQGDWDKDMVTGVSKLYFREANTLFEEYFHQGFAIRVGNIGVYNSDKKGSSKVSKFFLTNPLRDWIEVACEVKSSSGMLSVQSLNDYITNTRVTDAFVSGCTDYCSRWCTEVLENQVAIAVPDFELGGFITITQALVKSNVLFKVIESSVNTSNDTLPKATKKKLFTLCLLMSENSHVRIFEILSDIPSYCNEEEFAKSCAEMFSVIKKPVTLELSFVESAAAGLDLLIRRILRYWSRKIQTNKKVSDKIIIFYLKCWKTIISNGIPSLEDIKSKLANIYMKSTRVRYYVKDVIERCITVLNLLSNSCAKNRVCLNHYESVRKSTLEIISEYSLRLDTAPKLSLNQTLNERVKPHYPSPLSRAGFSIMNYFFGSVKSRDTKENIPEDSSSDPQETPSEKDTSSSPQNPSFTTSGGGNGSFSALPEVQDSVQCFVSINSKLPEFIANGNLHLFFSLIFSDYPQVRKIGIDGIENPEIDVLQYFLNRDVLQEVIGKLYELLFLDLPLAEKDDIKSSVLYLLARFASENEEGDYVKEKLLSWGLEVVFDLLSSLRQNVQRDALELTCALFSGSHTLRDKIMLNFGIDDVVGRLKNGKNEDIKVAAARTIANICYNETNRAEVVKRGVLPVLLEYAQQGRIQINNSVKSVDLVKGELLGAGTFAEVYRGTYKGSTVAIKEFRETSMEFRLEDFFKEVAIMCLLKHDNLVSFEGACIERSRDTESVFLIVTELMERGTLKDIYRKAPLSVNDIVKYAKDITKAMIYIHSVGIIHRDLKAENVLVTGSGVAKVADLGLAREINIDNGMTLMAGTPKWEAPEVLVAKKGKQRNYTKTADIYSFAMTLYELVVREEPFSDVHDIFELKRVVCDKKKRPKLPKDVNSGLKEIIKAAWTNDPTKRPLFEDVLCSLEKIQG